MTLLGQPTTTGGSTLDVLTSGATTALTSGEIGIFNTSYNAINPSTAGSSSPFYIVQGSYFTNDLIGSHGGYKESVKSKLINPKYISRIFWTQARTAVQQVVQIPVTCGLTCDTTYRLRVDVKGSPALRFLSHNLYRVLDSYTGCCSTTNPGYTKDPVATVLNWKEQLNSSPFFNNMVEARAFALKTTQAATSTVTAATTTSVVLGSAAFTTANGVGLGQRVVGTGIPANAFVTAFTSGTSVTITYPVQATAPSISSTVSIKFYNDLYMAQSMTTPVINYQGTSPLIPGTNVSTGTTVGAASLVSAAIGAHILVPAADAASFTSDCFLELTAAYVETKFGNCTFTPTDNYDLEPLKIIASVLDDAGNPCLTYCIGSANIGEAGIATIVQEARQVNGIGETVLRELILTGRYRQEAFPDGSNIDLFRMREIEANPGVMNMLSLANRNALYNKLSILHNVPRFNNPTGVFDNDQYLVEIAVPSTIPITQFFSAATYVTGGTSSTGGTGFGDYILESSIAAGGVGYYEMY
jgi:hypothetical protein